MKKFSFNNYLNLLILDELTEFRGTNEKIRKLKEQKENSLFKTKSIC